MRKKLAIYLFLGMAGIIGTCGAAIAQGPGMGPRLSFSSHRPPIERAFGLSEGQFWNNPDTIKQLNLTDDQRKSMDGILQDHRMTLVDLEGNLRKAELSLEPLMKADSPNQTAILAQIDKVAQARAELEKGNARYLLALRAKLTPDQWKQLQAIHAQRMENYRMRSHDGWRPGGPGPGRPANGQGNSDAPPSPPQ